MQFRLARFLPNVIFFLAALPAFSQEPYIIQIEPSIKHYEEVKFNSGAVKVYLPNRGAVAVEDVAVIINTHDSYSVQVGEFYAATYGIPAQNIIRVNFDSGFATDFSYFGPFLKEINSKLPANIQSIVVSFNNPNRIYCNRPNYIADAEYAISVTNALAFNTENCEAVNWQLAYNYSPSTSEPSAKPYDDFLYRPAMSLMADTVADAKAYINRSKAAGASYPDGTVYVSSKATFEYPNHTATLGGQYYAQEFANYWNHPDGLNTTVYDGALSQIITGKPSVLLYYFLGQGGIPVNSYSPGSILYNTFEGTASTAHAWLKAGASATIGSVNTYKGPDGKYTGVSLDFPLLTENYFMGAQSLEAIVAADQYGNSNQHNIGDPLTRPFGPPQITSSGNGLKVTTTSLYPNRRYQLLGGSSLESLSPVAAEFSLSSPLVYDLNIPGPLLSYYKIVDLGAVKPSGLAILPDSVGPFFRNANQAGFYYSTLSAWMKPKEAIKTIKFYIDGILVGNPYPPFNGQAENPQGWHVAASLASLLIPDGLHELKIRVIDTNHDVTTLTQAIKIVNKPDVTDPGLDLYSHAPNSVVSPESVIKGRFTDDTFVDQVIVSVGYDLPNGVPLTDQVRKVLPISEEFSFTLKDLPPIKAYEKYYVPGTPIRLFVTGRDPRGYHNFSIPLMYGAPGQDPNNSTPDPANPPAGKKIAFVSQEVLGDVLKAGIVTVMGKKDEKIDYIEFKIDGTSVAKVKVKGTSFTQTFNLKKLKFLHKNGKKHKLEAFRYAKNKKKTKTTIRFTY
jgi:uncharacterized protein (TIGR03790 family)